MKPGTKCMTNGFPAIGGFAPVAPEQITICKPLKSELPLPGPGWHIVRYADGGKLCMHESRFHVKTARTAHDRLIEGIRKYGTIWTSLDARQRRWHARRINRMNKVETAQ